MKKALILIFAAGVFCQTLYVTEWNEWKNKFNRIYAPGEEAERLVAFSHNLEFVDRFNAEKHSFTVGLNMFADLTLQEFKSKYLKFRMSSAAPAGIPSASLAVQDPPPESWDWREKHAVSGVKDQGQCGSCWAFSTTGTIEGANFIKTGKMVELSEQQFLDCDKLDQDCGGGDMRVALDWVKKTGGLESEHDYPYDAYRHRHCTFDPAKVRVNITGYVNVTAKSEDALTEAVAFHAPVSVAIDAGHESFQLYKEGIYEEWGCSPDNLDHGVLLVGYAEKHSKWDSYNYWQVKNSWGYGWGESGYIRMARKWGKSGNMCGIASYAQYALV